MPTGLVEFEFLIDGIDFDLEASIGGIAVGYARGIRRDNRLTLVDIQVKEFAPRRRSALRRLLPWAFAPVCLRGTGLGSELLRRFHHKADTEGVRETWGCVVERDLKNWPGLIDWYQRHGFVVVDPDSECKVKAIKKIVRTINPTGRP